MRRSTMLASTVAVFGAVMAIVVPNASAAPAGTYEGCPSGYVCMYPQNAGWNGGVPEHTWYHYGAYNLSNEYGTHRFFNNQTGTAVGHLCTGYNGGGTCYGQAPYTWSDDDFTPINSVTLTAS